MWTILIHVVTHPLLLHISTNTASKKSIFLLSTGVCIIMLILPQFHKFELPLLIRNIFRWIEGGVSGPPRPSGYTYEQRYMYESGVIENGDFLECTGAYLEGLVPGPPHPLEVKISYFMWQTFYAIFWTLLKMYTWNVDPQANLWGPLVGWLTKLAAGQPVKFGLNWLG